MDLNLIGFLQEYEAQVLFDIQNRLKNLALNAKNISGYYKNTQNIEISEKQHKILSYLHSIYIIDQKSDDYRPLSQSEIGRYINGPNSKSNWASKACRKLKKIGLLERNSDGKYYISKYGIFFIHCESSQNKDINWDNLAFIKNATICALQEDLARYIDVYVKSQIESNNQEESEEENLS